MAIKESNATALIRFTGLGIICFNKEKQRGEIGIIRDGRHQLTINIQKPQFKDGVESDIIVYETVKSYENLPAEDVSVEIKTNGKSATDGYEIYKAEGEFDRLNSDDFNDYRWIVQMDELHNGQIGKAQDEDRYPLSKMYIDDGFYYVHKLDTELLFEQIKKDADKNETARSLFGNVAETVGVKIESDEVVFNIKYGETDDSFVFSSEDGFPCRIEIKNMDYSEDAAVSDMPDYYKYFESNDGVEIEFEMLSDSGEAGGGISGRQFCHVVGGGDFTSIDDLE